MMSPRVRIQMTGEARRGAAAVEVALLLPVLVFSSMMAVDFARVAYVQLALQNCARNGALYEFYTKAGYSLPSSWTTLSTAVNADAPPGTTVTATAATVTLSSYTYITVTATTTFQPIALPSMHGLPSLPGSVTLTQTATMPYPAGASPVP
jgi:TadE-like protein